MLLLKAILYVFSYFIDLHIFIFVLKCAEKIT